MTTEPLPPEEPPVAGATSWAPPVEPVPPERGYDLGAAAAGIVFVAAGLAFLLDRLGAIEIPNGVVLPGVIVGLGLALVVSSMQRRGAVER
jgi:hypothetical protein